VKVHLIGIGVLIALAILIIAFGPIVAGYHHGYGGIADVASGEHCIRWFGSVWCRTTT
jgi:hypothetical protein